MKLSDLIDKATRQAASLDFIVANIRGLSEPQRASISMAAALLREFCEAVDTIGEKTGEKKSPYLTESARVDAVVALFDEAERIGYGSPREMAANFIATVRAAIA